MEALMLNKGTVNMREIPKEVVTPTELHAPETVRMTDEEWLMAEAEKKANLAGEAIDILRNLLMDEAEPEKSAVAFFKAILMNDDESVRKAVAILVDEADTEAESEKDYDDFTDEEEAEIMAKEIDLYYENLCKKAVHIVDWGTKYTLAKADRASKRKANLNIKRKAYGLQKPHDHLIKTINKMVARRVSNLRVAISTTKDNIANMKADIASTSGLNEDNLWKKVVLLVVSEDAYKKLMAEKQKLEYLTRPHTFEGNPRYYREPNLSSACNETDTGNETDWINYQSSSGDSEKMVTAVLPKQKHPKKKKKKAPRMVAHA